MKLLGLMKEFIKTPKEVGSVVPSSSYLVNALTKDIKPDDHVIELGSGTGCISTSIINKHCKKVTLYENNDSLYSNLKSLENKNTTIKKDAFDMTNIHSMNSIDTVISALPLFNLSYDIKSLILEKINIILKEDGRLILFTYREKLPFNQSQLNKNHLEVIKKEKVWLNFPPATVYTIKKVINDKD